MNWINIEEDFPIDQDLVCVKLERGDVAICRYRNDSFGLGDNDFEVIQWRSMFVPDQASPNHILQPTGQAWDHINGDFSGLQRNLV